MKFNELNILALNLMKEHEKTTKNNQIRKN